MLSQLHRRMKLACCLQRALLSATRVPPLPAWHSRASSHSSDGNNKNISHLFMPVNVEVNKEDVNVGEEIAGPLVKAEVLRVLNAFYTDTQMREVALEHGLDEYLYQQAFISFRKHCVDSSSLPTDLHILLSDITQGAGHVHDLFPSFLRHARQVFPHLLCMGELCKISDLTTPVNWYPEARAMNRKLIFHAGPTNSGKTYHAMEAFLQAESGVYCGPLKLLAAEVFSRSNEKGTPCDLVTGEERRYSSPDLTPSPHTACTVEMVSLQHKYDVAIIDEVQLLRDPLRGWAWTRALLGVCAREVHVCGEEGAVHLVEDLALCTGEQVEVRRYKRLTPLTTEDAALCTFSALMPGDCVVCFSKKDVHYVSRAVEKLGHQVAVIYGGLPPGTKLAMAQKFNDPSNPCKILVATDAIGMGLNLSIRRVVFYSLIKPFINAKGEKEMETLSVSQALQIAGRAGRYGTQWDHGFVTCMKPEDLPTLRRLLSSRPEPLRQAGLHPTAEQIELFAYLMPHYTLSNLIDIFVNVCTVDESLYFVCAMEDFKFLADLIQHISMPLRARYLFCCAPISRKMPFVCAMFLKFARQYAQAEPASLAWLCQQVKWPFAVPQTILDLVRLEEVFDVFDLYLWLGYRFPETFPEMESVKVIQTELDGLIEQSVASLTTLLRNSGPGTTAHLDTEDALTILRRKEREARGLRDSVVVQLDEADPTYEEEDPHPQQPSGGRGRLTQRLLSQGLLSPAMLAQLQREWRSAAPVAPPQVTLLRSCSAPTGSVTAAPVAPPQVALLPLL
ncbi:ATP-dependent RNA helicase SUV3 homolog, mitochondrial isoform X2 [Hyalella azteca]|uniref:ATP-dependent RNA helicase SUV3 homolog, mitochondrial n=1 Tax=Hyalella azteca TaxID=294128 RepID=A0A8B7NWL2_HYAAZ|nr:ATP-dependent RNA helicase SUV3 homolog, mitochondrial isoform X1 [Hyalella azteca]XP_047737563.1 ATP-dependent RNA helicase SUV3 homolog, mitochondrial isoform X2 [Hyalella azteca]